MTPGGEIGLVIDQTLTQDATGTMVMAELEALGLDRVKTEVSVQYVDHNLLQGDERNAEDHVFLRSACRRFGLWYSKPGNGVSHPTHMQRFGIPGQTLAGSDSHTCAAGSLGMLDIWSFWPTGGLSPWFMSEALTLEMLPSHCVSSRVNPIIAYLRSGLA